jgi:hypothetical protein
MQQCAYPKAADSRLEKKAMQKQSSKKTASHHHVPMFHAVEMALIAPLIRSTNFSGELIDECERRGYLPLKLMDGLAVVKFLLRTVLAAQSAQRIYKIPASVLLSIAMDHHGFMADNLIKNLKSAVEWPGCDCCYSPETLRWFMEMASQLAESRKYQKAMRLLPDIEKYVSKIYSLGMGDTMDGEQILANIEEYGLEDCDLAASLQPGEYTKDIYKAVVDSTSGKVRLENGLIGSGITLERERAARTSVDTAKVA